MKVQLKVAGMLAVLVADCDRGAHPWTQSECRGNRQDHRNGEARWHSSAHEGYRHVEGPVLREVSRKQSGPPGIGRGRQECRPGKCRSLHLAGLAGRRGQPEVFHRSGIRSERLHVHSARDRHESGRGLKVTTSDQTAHNIHPEPDPKTGNIPWNRSQPPGAQPIVQSWKAEEVAIPGEVQHPSLDARLSCRRERTLRHDRRQRFVHHRKCAPRKLHRHLLAGNLRNPDAKGDRGGRTIRQPQTLPTKRNSDCCADRASVYGTIIGAAQRRGNEFR